MNSSDNPRLAILAALWDGIANGTLGSPAERLRALAAKQVRDRELARLAKLDVRQQGEVWLRLAAGEDPEELLPPDLDDELAK